MALKPTAFGRAPQNHNTLDSAYGKQTEHWNGFDVTLDARLQNGLSLQVGTSTGQDVGRRLRHRGEVAGDAGGAGQPFAAVIVPGGTPNGWRPRQFCNRQTPWLTQFKTFGVYTIPKAEVQVSGTFRSIPGDALRAVFNATNAYLAANSTLGRPLAGGAANIAIDLVAPYSVFLPRRNELDMRFGKVLRAGRSRYRRQRGPVQRAEYRRRGEREPELRRVAAADADPERAPGEVQRAVRLLKTVSGLRSPVLQAELRHWRPNRGPATSTGCRECRCLGG